MSMNRLDYFDIHLSDNLSEIQRQEIKWLHDETIRMQFYIERLEKRLKTALHCEHTVMQQESFNFSKELKAYIESEMAKLRGEK